MCIRDRFSGLAVVVHDALAGTSALHQVPQRCRLWPRRGLTDRRSAAQVSTTSRCTVHSQQGMGAIRLHGTRSVRLYRVLRLTVTSPKEVLNNCINYKLLHDLSLWQLLEITAISVLKHACNGFQQSCLTFYDYKDIIYIESTQGMQTCAKADEWWR